METYQMEEKKDNGKKSLIKIACCGDSITFGLLSTAPEKSYPSVLQRLLGEDFRVENFGRNGATAIADYPFFPDRNSPYLKSPEYARALEFCPDIAVVMLGMNDGNPTLHFNAENGGPMSDRYRHIYEDTLRNLLQNLRDLPSHPQLFLVRTTAMRRIPGPLFSQAYVRDFTENLEKLREIQGRIADGMKIGFIDPSGFMDDAEFYADGCHLTDAGYERLAMIIAKGMGYCGNGSERPQRLI